MGQYTKKLPDIVYSGSSTDSPGITGFDDCDGITVFKTLTSTATHTVQVSNTTESTATFYDLQSAGSDITLANSRDAVVISPVPFRQLRLTTSHNSTGVFPVIGTFHVH